MTDSQLIAASKLAQISQAPYTDVCLAFASPTFAWSGLAANTWAGTGLGFSSAPQDVAQAIRVLHQKGKRVLLSVGGATYSNWGNLAAEAGKPGGSLATPIRNALAQCMVDLKIDGLDVDYEVDGSDSTNVSYYAHAIQAMREAVDQASQADGRPRELALAAWSTGADYTAQAPNLANPLLRSYWGGSASRERLTFFSVVSSGSYAGDHVGQLLDVVSVMAYDAGYQHYDPTVAYDEYRAMLPSDIVVTIGLEIPTEAWGGAILVTKNADAHQAGTLVELDQYGNAVNAPYSVERAAQHVMANTINANPQDGLMVWQVLKTQTVQVASPTGATIDAATPASITTQAASSFGSQPAVAPIP